MTPCTFLLCAGQHLDLSSRSFTEEAFDLPVGVLAGYELWCGHTAIFPQFFIINLLLTIARCKADADPAVVGYAFVFMLPTMIIQQAFPTDGVGELVSACEEGVKVVCSVHGISTCWYAVDSQRKLAIFPYSFSQNAATHLAYGFFRRSCSATATHYNTHQHTAAHCNTLQHTARHCNILQKHCNKLQHIWPIAFVRSHNPRQQHTATHCNTLQQATPHFTYSFCMESRSTAATHCNTMQQATTYTAYGFCRESQSGTEW